MKRISSADNQFIKLANRLKNRKYRDKENLFVVEGLRSVEELQEYPELIRAVFLESGMIASMEELINALPEKCFEIDTRLMQTICSTDTPQGAAAIVAKPAWRLADMLQEDGPVVILDQIADPGNVGSIIRSCWAMDVNGVLLTKGCADPFSPKVVRSTMGGILNVPLIQDASDDTWGILKAENFRFIGTSGQAEQSYFDVELTGKCALILGSEAFGISGSLINQCDEFVKIPMNAKVDSLNVAAACAIIISEARRQRYGEVIS